MPTDHAAAESSSCGTGGVGFATGSVHGCSGGEPAAVGCCGSGLQAVAISAPSCG
jgi:hypothetical protein